MVSFAVQWKDLGLTTAARRRVRWPDSFGIPIAQLVFS